MSKCFHFYCRLITERHIRKFVSATFEVCTEKDGACKREKMGIKISLCRDFSK